ncbi:hypothetical protein JG687_00018541, partial [Phytophthora cactorum]
MLKKTCVFIFYKPVAVFLEKPSLFQTTMYRFLVDLRKYYAGSLLHLVSIKRRKNNIRTNAIGCLRSCCQEDDICAVIWNQQLALPITSAGLPAIHLTLYQRALDLATSKRRDDDRMIGYLK